MDMTSPTSAVSPTLHSSIFNLFSSDLYFHCCFFLCHKKNWEEDSTSFLTTLLFQIMVTRATLQDFYDAAHKIFFDPDELGRLCEFCKYFQNCDRSVKDFAFTETIYDSNGLQR